jgi:HK97 family phage major capsid protein
MNPLEIRLKSRMQQRDLVQSQHEGLLVDRDEGNLSDTDKKQISMWREEISGLDEEIEGLADDIEAHRKAEEKGKALRRALLGAAGVETDEDGVVYPTMASYARDVILTRESPTSHMIQSQFGDKEGIEAARARLSLLQRTPANTLSSNVSGLIPEQHIAQIFQVINASRPLVASGTRVNLERGTLSFPKITTRPVVAAQSAEKTEAGNTGMVVGMETATATTYLGGGDLSWQAINWSTPDALDLWFRLTAADYALKTEQDAGEVIQTAAFLNDISTLFGATGTYAEFITAVAAGIGAVYANSGDLADTLYLAPDRAAYLLGLTSTATAMFANGSLSFVDASGNISGLNVVISRGLDSGVIAVGVRSKLIVAETAGAPVELRVTEPAIGGVEVGLIGAFEAVVAEDEAFALLTAAS